jgi:hypothetical protein
MAFTRAFYLALLSGRTVRHSFDIAREALKASPCVPDSVLEGEKFVLLPEVVPGKIEHDRPIFTSRAVSFWPLPGQCRMGPGPYLPPSSASSSSPAILTRSSSSTVTTASGAGSDSSISAPVPGPIERSSSGGSRGNYGYFSFGNSHIPLPPPDFEGREVDMYRVITTVLSRRLVSLVGEVGLGKSALAAAACMYMGDRGMFEDGIVYLKAHALGSHRALLEGIQAAVQSGPYKVAARMRAMAAQPPQQSLSASGRLVPPLSLSLEGAADLDAAFDPMYQLEEQIVAALGPLRVLLVLDNIDGLLKDESDSAADLKYFLGRLFECCKHVKVLVVATETLGMRHVGGFGVVENCVSLGPLSLRNSLRLFARLTPALMTSEQKAAFVRALLPPGPPGERHTHVTVNSRELTPAAAQVLSLFGNGHPARIVKLACESSHDSVEALQAMGESINNPDYTATATSGSRSQGSRQTLSGDGASQTHTPTQAQTQPVSIAAAAATAASHHLSAASAIASPSEPESSPAGSFASPFPTAGPVSASVSLSSFLSADDPVSLQRSTTN